MSDVNLISVVPALLVVIIGWFINNWLDRRHEIAKKRNDIRIKVLRSFTDLSKKLNFKQGELNPHDVLDVQVDFLVFGYEDEIDLFDNFVTTYNLRKMEEASEHLTALTNLVRTRIRKELNLPKLPVKNSLT